MRNWITNESAQNKTVQQANGHSFANDLNENFATNTETLTLQLDFDLKFTTFDVSSKMY